MSQSHVEDAESKVIDKRKMIDLLYLNGGPALPKGSTPHAGQQVLHGSDARFRVSVWGRRAGKSFGGATDAVPNFFGMHTDGFPHMGWIVAPNYELGEREYRVLWHHLVLSYEVPMKFKYYNKGPGGQMGMRTKWGAECWVKSAEKPDKSLLGEGLSWVILAEAARLDRSIWEQYIEPSLADRNGTALFTTTPQGTNWLYSFFQRGQSPDFPEWASFQFPSWVNEFRFKGGLRFKLVAPKPGDQRWAPGDEVPWEAVAADPALQVEPVQPGSDFKLANSWKTLSRHYFWQEYGAQFRTQAGRVYPDFDEGYHVVDYKFVRGRRNFRTIDYGTTNPFVCLDIQVDEYDNVYVWREWRRVGYSTQDNVQWCMRPDEIGYDIEAVVGDPYEPDGRLTTENAWGIPCQFVTIGIRNGIELVEQWLKLTKHVDDTIRPRLYVDRSCRGLIEEMKAYRWPATLDEELYSDEEYQLQEDDNPKEVPLKMNDHGPDALRNWFAWMWGSTMVHHAENIDAWNENTGETGTGDEWYDSYIQQGGRNR